MRGLRQHVFRTGRADKYRLVLSNDAFMDVDKEKFDQVLKAPYSLIMIVNYHLLILEDVQGARRSS